MPSSSWGQSAGSFDFAKLHTETWDAAASTSVRWHPTLQRPIVEGVECKGNSRQISFSMDESAQVTFLRVDFLSDAADGSDLEFITALGDHLWLYIDGERWEYAHIPKHSWEFTNVRYPVLKQDGIIIPIWRGIEAVRKDESQPWLNLKLFYDRLITAKDVAWGFKSRDWKVVDRNEPANQLPEGWQQKRYRIDNSGLQEAVSWCAGQVVADAAYILPDKMKVARQPGSN